MQTQAAPRFFQAPSADVSPKATVGDRTKIWDLAQVREGAVVKEDCVIGRSAYIDTDVQVEARCKIQNLAQIYAPATLAEGVFVGPGVIFTNDHQPRAVTPDGHLKSAEDWDHVGVTVWQGASIGARAVCVAPVSIGRWAMVGAGAVVTHDVPDFALVVGNPARQIGWVGQAGVRLVADSEVEGLWVCPLTGAQYREENGQLKENDEH